jgi:hypothetical protein
MRSKSDPLEDLLQLAAVEGPEGCGGDCSAHLPSFFLLLF